MRPPNHDPLTALKRRDPDLVSFIDARTRECFNDHTARRKQMTPMVLASMESDLASIFVDANRQGARLPDCTPVALDFKARRHVQIAMVWHIEPWHEPLLDACCVHVGSCGTVTDPEKVRPVDLWRCAHTKDTHIVWGDSYHERNTLPGAYLEHVTASGLTEADDELVCQTIIAARVVRRRPELLQLRPKRMM